MCIHRKEILTNMTDIDNNTNNGGAPDATTPDGTPITQGQKKKEPSEVMKLWRKIRGSRITALVFAVTLVILSIFAIAFAINATGSGKPGSHYLSDSAFYLPFAVLLISALILSLLPFIFLDRTRLSKEHLVQRIFNLFPAFGAVATSYLFFYFSTAKVFEDNSKWALYLSLAAGVSAVYFILKIINCNISPNVMASLRIITAIGVFLLSALIIISLYLDYNTELNSHFKLSVQFGAVGVMLGTMADSRSALGNVSKRRYISFKAIALLLTSTGAASVLIRAVAEIAEFKQKQGLLSMTVDDLVVHFQSSPSASASYVICSLFFITYTLCAIPEIICAAAVSNNSEQ